MLSTRWKWKLKRWQDSVETWWSRGGRGTPAARHKVCPHCRGLIGLRATECAHCGTKVYRGGPAFIARVVGSLFPGHPPVSSAILLLNFLLFLLAWLLTGSGSQGPRGPFSLGGIGGRALVRLGAGNGFLVSQGEYWRVVTPIFLHASVAHILMNSLVLYQLCPEVEDLCGSEKFLALYLTAGIAGNLVSFWWHGPFGILVGASGALFGMMGVLMVAGLQRGGSLGRMVYRSMMQWAVYALIFSFVLGGDNAAHIGGLVGGAATAMLVGVDRPRSPLADRVWSGLGVLGGLVIGASFLMVVLRAAIGG